MHSSNGAKLWDEWTFPSCCYALYTTWMVSKGTQGSLEIFPAPLRPLHAGLKVTAEGWNRVCVRRIDFYKLSMTGNCYWWLQLNSLLWTFCASRKLIKSETRTTPTVAEIIWPGTRVYTTCIHQCFLFLEILVSTLIATCHRQVMIDVYASSGGQEILCSFSIAVKHQRRLIYFRNTCSVKSMEGVQYWSMNYCWGLCKVYTWSKHRKSRWNKTRGACNC